MNSLCTKNLDYSRSHFQLIPKQEMNSLLKTKVIGFSSLDIIKIGNLTDHQQTACAGFLIEQVGPAK